MRKAFLLLFSILCCHVSWAQTTTENKFVSDFRILVTSMKELYPMAYRSISKDQFTASVKETEEKLAVVNDKNRASYLFQRFLYQFADAHASVESIYGDLDVKKILPFKIFICNNKIYIKNYPARPDLKGTRILSIDGFSDKTILDSLVVLGGDDGNRTTSLVVQSLFNSFYGAFISQKDVFNIQTDKGELKVPCVQKGDSLYHTLVKNDWQDYMVTDHSYVKKEVNDTYAYFRFLSFDKKAEGYNIEKEFNSLIKEINKKKVPNLVIDLRYNEGGNAMLAGRMVAQLTDKPFRIFERLILTPPGRPTWLKYMESKYIFRLRGFGLKKVDEHYEKVRFEKRLKLMQPSKNAYKGKIYILTGPMTVSTATMFCKYLTAREHVVFVGSETSGAINYFCAHNHCVLDLPNSGIRTTFGLELIELKKGSSENEKQVGLIPSNYIRYSLQDLLDGKDKEMDWVLRNISEKK